MSYIDLKVAPRREDRLKACIAHGGSVRELGGSGKKSCLKDDGERSFTQGSICLLLPALAMLNTLPDNVVLMHSAIGCGTCTHSHNANVRFGGNVRWGEVKDGTWLSTALNETDVISGGESKLEQAIIEAERILPASCSRYRYISSPCCMVAKYPAGNAPDAPGIAGQGLGGEPPGLGDLHSVPPGLAAGVVGHEADHLLARKGPVLAPHVPDVGHLDPRLFPYLSPHALLQRFSEIEEPATRLKRPLLHSILRTSRNRAPSLTRTMIQG